MADIDTNTYSNYDYYKSVYPDIQINNEGLVQKYTSIDSEYNALLCGAAMREISFMGIIELTGKDSVDFIHRISTNKILGLPFYSSVNTIFTNEKGRIIDRVQVLNFDDRLLVIGSGEFRHKLFSWLNKYIIAEDIKAIIPNNKYSLYEVLGSQADSFLTLVFGKEMDTIKLNEIKKVNIERAEYYCLKMNDLGIIKFRILSSREDSLFLLRYMHENSSVFDYRMVGEEAYNILRVEKGIPIAPNELNDQYNPHEAKLLDEVSFTKGCYIGQEVIARLDTYDKVQRELSWVMLDRMPSSEEILLYYNDIEAGKLTSIVYSLAIKQPIGLAYVKKEFAVNGNQFTAKDKSGGRYEVSLKAIPVRK